ncbi:hypothetical protein [Nitrogeniibacter aestuarii]|uniref:hypothetical protein n=1 Tax=Nitrogeniibacter aestuarii TaxID=2815343 RepID=UPI001E380D8A|nr:hypothetical protein [Nitrogeniibacter aestuarii]
MSGVTLPVRLKDAGTWQFPIGPYHLLAHRCLNWLAAACVVSLLVLTGCAGRTPHYSQYQLDERAGTAIVELSSRETIGATIFTNGLDCSSPHHSDENKFLVEAYKELAISVGTNDGHMRCDVIASFIPMPAEHYLVTFELNRKKRACFLKVRRYATENGDKLQPVPTFKQRRRRTPWDNSGAFCYESQ